ncbi:MAG: acetyl-CoA carboxylase biotin carboxyl carrier protein [Halobacteriovoraceae bacterium]|jgi:acetyl-CoA carboxylase biotin carboxyl carrier protein|nr:acetyl-CoA carboxylase biotin carboxyl carrier protein [Halobacteriovoraceae bacterium]MBT5092903.1 acetyl-CoA carboxylase biotin carboxyl carrier protein [Halobacteriovoraceae bacterium]
MKLEKLEKFIELAKEAGVSQLKYENDNEKYSVTLPVAGAQLVQQVAQPANAIGNSSPTATVSDPNVIEITSPFVGTFYRSSSPEAASYAKVGDRVSTGQVLCIVEAMKIMNEIEADASGEVVEICVENETYVEFGQVLFRLKA